MDRKGFTLIEIVTVIVVLAIMGAFTMSFLINNSRTYHMMRAQRELYQDGTYIMERISRDISRLNGNEWYLSCRVHKGSTHQETQFLCTRYSLNGTALLRNNQVIARDVVSFSQPDYTSPPYTISITLEKGLGVARTTKNAEYH